MAASPAPKQMDAPDSGATKTSPATASPVMARRLPSWLIVLLAVVGVGLDQLCKGLAILLLDPARPVSIIGELVQFQLARNPGAAFSMGEAITPVFAAVAALALVAIIVFVLPRLITRLDGVIVAALMAGIAGNLLDRIFRPPGPLHGYVVDFIWVSHFAIFNVADIFITCGAIAVALRLIVTAAHEREPEAAA